MDEKKIELLRQYVNYICEGCGIVDKKLHPHRIKRGNMGGKYELRNIKMVCSKCHLSYHANEFRNVKSWK